MISYMLSQLKKENCDMPNGDANNIERETITIAMEVYKTLLHDSEILNALRAGGVDGWAFYDEALSAAGL